MTYVCDNKACEEVRPETVKSILENMDFILEELDAELRQIERAIYSPSNDGGDTKSKPQDECLLGTLNRQRNHAQDLLDIVIHIRDGLW